MTSDEDMMAPCGMLCGPCDIRKVPFDDKAAKNVIAWFREMDWLKQDEGIEEILAREMYCTGCRGSRKIHWGWDEDTTKRCRILQCCIDEKKHEFCSDCDDFACDDLKKWAEEYEGHMNAFNRLKKNREKSIK